jgi:hypothetical protein
MVFGKANALQDDDEKVEALRRFTEGLFPGRWDNLRPMTAQELKATAVLRMDIEEASAKVRRGPPGDADEADFPVWAGVIPMESRLVPAETAPGVPAGIELPAGLNGLIRSGRLR